MFDLGVLALRLVLGAVFLGHGAQKAFGAFGGPGFAGATGFVGSLGFRPARVWAALAVGGDRKSTRLNSSHITISYAVFCLKKKKQTKTSTQIPRSQSGKGCAAADSSS